MKIEIIGSGGAFDSVSTSINSRINFKISLF